MKRWPEGYLLAEQVFTREEENRFWQYSDMEWKDAHRDTVLDAREQFRQLWNKVNVDRQVGIG